MRKGRYRFDCSSIQAILPKKMVIREKARIRRKIECFTFYYIYFFSEIILSIDLFRQFLCRLIMSAAKRFSEKLIFGREAKLRMINLPQYQFISCKSLKEDKKF